MPPKKRNISGPANRKRGAASSSSASRSPGGGPGYHRSFVPPTAAERAAAVGPFPGAPHAASARSAMIAASSTAYHPLDRPSLVARRRRAASGGATAPTEGEEGEGVEANDAMGRAAAATDALEDLDEPRLFGPVAASGGGKKKTKKKCDTERPIPRPRDALDWLAQVPEEGQTFDEYVRTLTSRSGRVRPLANAGGEDVVLLPIVRADDDRAGDGGGGAPPRWPDHGPPLDGLAEYARAFFDRRVCVLPPAMVRAATTCPRPGGSGKAGRNRRAGRSNGGGKRTARSASASAVTGAFAAAAGGNFTMTFPTADGGTSSSVRVVGRADPPTGRAQLQVESVLEELAAFRENRGDGAHGGGGRSSSDLERRSFCVVGVTMMDLYDGPSDLFCAGMAFGGSKVAVFSFHRYHPRLKMHPLHWHRFGYGAKSDVYSYYEDADQEPAGLTRDPPTWTDLSGAGRAEFNRRCVKLLTHELGHLYGLDHCIHNRCLMMGTGHLVEDFAAPPHPCGVCLRKLQWRLGFSIAGRYGLLGDAMRSLGLLEEERWVRRKEGAISSSTAADGGPKVTKKRKVLS